MSARWVDNLTLDEWRLRQGLKPKELAQLLGFPVGMTWNYCLPPEHGEFKLPRPARMQRIWEVTNGEVRPDSFYRLPVLTRKFNPAQPELGLAGEARSAAA